MIKTNFQPKIGLKQPNVLTQRPQPSIWVKKIAQCFLECRQDILQSLFRVETKTVISFVWIPAHIGIE